MADSKGVMVYAEASQDKLSSLTTELLGIGRKLADELAEPLCAVLCGSGINKLAQQAIAYGADRVYLVDDPLLKDYQTDSHLAAMEKAAKEAAPAIILLGQTAAGRDLAPRLAFRLKAAVATDCVELNIDAASKRLHMTRPVYGGNALATFTTDCDPQLATVRAKAFPAAAPDDSRQGEVITVAAGLQADAVRTRLLKKVVAEVEGVRLEDAAIVISGGRGIGSAEGFKQLEELASLFKGAVGASRPPCDNGWVPEVLQVGITGKIIAPDLYIAVALSGSSQHLSGCSGAKNIIAINKDAEANIFKAANYGIVGDWKKVIPAFTEKVKELLAE
ncbi:MAG: electron transfer flavoprotein subunit alpha/FixB family protein [Dehalococcoidales bacterium]